GPGEPRGDAEIDALPTQPLAQLAGLFPPRVRERDIAVRVAVQQAPRAGGALRVPDQDRSLHTVHSSSAHQLIRPGGELDETRFEPQLPPEGRGLMVWSEHSQHEPSEAPTVGEGDELRNEPVSPFTAFPRSTDSPRSFGSASS